MKTSWESVKTVGRYQWVLLLPYVIAVIFCHWANMGILIVVPRQVFRCVDDTPSYKNLSLEEQLRLIPIGQCYKPRLGFELTSEELARMNRSEFQMEKCEHFEFDHQLFDFTHTEKFSLVCDRSWLIPMTATIYMVGFFCAAVGSGTISDRLGRKTAMIGACLVGFVSNMVAAYAPNVEVFLAARFFVAVGDISSYTCGLVLTTELLRKDQRIIPKVMASTLGCVGTALIGVAGIVLRDSRYFQTLTAMAFLIVAIVFWFLSVESPRWLAAENRQADADEVVSYIASVNGLNRTQLDHLCQGKEDDKQETTTVLDLFRTPTLRKRTIIKIFEWFSLVFVYYALTYNLGSFYSDVRVSVMISGILEMPSVLIAIFTIDRMGRPCASCVYLVLAGLCCFLMIPFVEDKGSPVLLTLALVGKMMGGNEFFIVYISTQEMFPTVCRNTGLGCCSSVARVAGMLAPQIVLLNAFWPATTVTILGVFGVVGGLIVPFIPDTTGIELPQTLYEGEHFIEDHVYSLRWPTKEKIELINRRHSTMFAGQEMKKLNGFNHTDAEAL